MCVVHLCSTQLLWKSVIRVMLCVCVWFTSAVLSLLWKSVIRVMLVCVCGSSLQCSACSGNRTSELCLCVCVVHLCSAQLALEIGHHSYACVCVWFISAVLSLLWKSVIIVMLVGVCVVHLCSAQLALEIGHHSYACVCVWFISAVLSLLWKSVIRVMLVCMCGSSLQCSAYSGNRSS